MRFEKFLLDDYLQTKEGKKLFVFFTEFRENFFRQQYVFFQIVNSFLNTPEAEYEFSIEDDNNQYIMEKLRDLNSKKGIKSIDSFTNVFFDMFIDAEFNCDDLRFFQQKIPFLSIFYFIKQPEFAFPYLFPSHFYIFAEICEKFDIPCPNLPGKNQHLNRIKYYFDLCRTMYDFRLAYGLSPVELCVFIYGFAPRFLVKFVEELPPPNNIHIVGAAKEDVEEYTRNPFNEKSIFIWQGTEEIMPGDIILLYERAPYSQISSVWRAVSRGFDDPFHYYAGKVFMSRPVKVPCIKFNSLLSDSVWSKNGLVKANMQGIGFKRTIITYDEYESLKKLFCRCDENFDTSVLPEPPSYAQFYHGSLSTEKDVEEKLLEPLLTKLGYDVKREFTRQFPIRMGRGVRYYPDYALHAKGGCRPPL